MSPASTPATARMANAIRFLSADAIEKVYPRAEVLVHADPKEVVKRLNT